MEHEFVILVYGTEKRAILALLPAPVSGMLVICIHRWAPNCAVEARLHCLA